MRGLLILLLGAVLLTACGYKTDLTLPESASTLVLPHDAGTVNAAT